MNVKKSSGMHRNVQTYKKTEEGFEKQDQCDTTFM